METPAPDPAGARRRLYLSLTLLLIGGGVGGALDRAWHGSHPFDSFFSPPHIFIYSFVGAAALAALSLQWNPRLRAAFGPGVKLPLLPAAVPPPLVLLGGGLAVIALAGVLDDAWHTAFGLDETSWSTPHSMLAWGSFLAILGYTSARMALSGARPMSNASIILFGILLLQAGMNIVTGPIGHHNTPETVRAVRDWPVIVAQPAARHAFDVYLTWNLDRTNPIFPALGALGAGVGLALVRGLTKRNDHLLVIAFLASLLMLLNDRTAARFFDLAGDPATWLPLPVFPAALAVVLAERAGIGERIAWASGGLVFGLIAFGIWGAGPWAFVAALAAAGTIVVGAAVGSYLASVVRAPDQRTLAWLVPVLGVGMPILTGVLDFYLRANTPWLPA